MLVPLASYNFITFKASVVYNLHIPYISIEEQNIIKVSVCECMCFVCGCLCM